MRRTPRDPRTGRFRKKYFGVVALALALGTGVAAVGGGIGSGTGASSGGSGSSVSRDAGSPRTARAKDRDRQGIATRLARPGRQVRHLAGDTRTDCAGVAYGRTRTWFAGHPCAGVGRALFEVREGGARAYVAVAVVEMPATAEATELQDLVDTYGTGNVRELRTPRGVRWTGRRYHSVREGSTVVNAQAEPAGSGAASARLAASVTRDATRG